MKQNRGNREENKLTDKVIGSHAWPTLITEFNGQHANIAHESRKDVRHVGGYREGAKGHIPSVSLFHLKRSS